MRNGAADRVPDTIASPHRMKYFALVMSALYVLGGCVFLFTDALQEHIRTFRLPLGIMLMAYGVVRAYLWRRKYADQTESE